MHKHMNIHPLITIPAAALAVFEKNLFFVQILDENTLRLETSSSRIFIFSAFTFGCVVLSNLHTDNVLTFHTTLLLSTFNWLFDAFVELRTEVILHYYTTAFLLSIPITKLLQKF
jgi:hypothetical protein